MSGTLFLIQQKKQKRDLEQESSTSGNLSQASKSKGLHGGWEQSLGRSFRPHYRFSCYISSPTSNDTGLQARWILHIARPLQGRNGRSVMWTRRRKRKRPTRDRHLDSRALRLLPTVHRHLQPWRRNQLAQHGRTQQTMESQAAEESRLPW